MKGTSQCFAAKRPTGSSRQEEERTTFAPVRSSSFCRRRSSRLSTTYGNCRGLGVFGQLSTPSISRNITFMTYERNRATSVPRHGGSCGIGFAGGKLAALAAADADGELAGLPVAERSLYGFRRADSFG